MFEAPYVFRLCTRHVSSMQALQESCEKTSTVRLWQCIPYTGGYASLSYHRVLIVLSRSGASLYFGGEFELSGERGGIGTDYSLTLVVPHIT